MSIQLRYLQPDSRDAWAAFFEALHIKEVTFEAVVEDITQAKGAVALRLLSPGKSGARVVVASLIDDRGEQVDWVVKVASPAHEHLIVAEGRAVARHVRAIVPDLVTRTSGPRAIGYRYHHVETDLAGHIDAATTRAEVEAAVERTFARMAGWYAHRWRDLNGFFDLHRIDDRVREKVEGLGQGDLLSLWGELSQQWPATRGVLTTTCHGDLNDSNVLLDKAGEVFLIDFARTGVRHWASDFARLERHLRARVLEADWLPHFEDADSAFNGAAPGGDGRIARVLAGIRALREQARRTFGAAVAALDPGGEGPGFEQEYFHMLAFQQLCLLASEAQELPREAQEAICASTRRILSGLLRRAPKEYYFGYACVEVKGVERVLLARGEEGEWNFPVAAFKPAGVPVERAIDDAVRGLFSTSTQVHQEFLESGFSSPEIHRVIAPNSEVFTVAHDGRNIPILPVFFKIRLRREVDMRRNDLFWAPKAPFFALQEGVSHRGEALRCGQPALWRASRCDRIVMEFGHRILECVDIVVFREEADGVRFLTLRRRQRDDVVAGWEYPKGGLEYHETVQEGAIRELLEETGTESIGQFFYGGDLGQETSDVSWRKKKNYDALRVFGLTYLFAGLDAELKLGDEHDALGWETLDDAREKLWIGRYGKAFLDRWKRRRLKIQLQVARPVSVAFQVTEDCPFKCLFCLRRSDHERPLGLEDKKQIIDLLAERGVQRLTFTGGEIFTLGKEEVFQIVEHAHNHRIHTCLSTTGTGLRRDEIHRLDRILDQFLLPLHSIRDETLPLMFGDPEHWKRHRDKVADILEWTADRGLIIEVSTVASRHNLDEIEDIGRFLFERHPRVLWRVDEYYANGIAAGTKDEFEITSGRFRELRQAIEGAFPGPLAERRIRFSDKHSRSQAPDVMITPRGNLVTSSNHSYETRGDYRQIPHWDFKNRRPWSDYRDYVRTDWDW